MTWGTAAAAVIAALGSQSQNTRNIGLAREQMHFQKMMSGTAVRRRAADLRAAGINPILAGKFDASSPAGALAHTENVGAAAANAGIQAYTAQSQGELRDVQTRIQENIATIAKDLTQAWQNTGATLTQWLANASWETIGNAIGKSIGESTDKIISYIKSTYETPQEAAKDFLSPEHQNFKDMGGHHKLKNGTGVIKR